jgi:hypothetical protein
MASDRYRHRHRHRHLRSWAVFLLKGLCLSYPAMFLLRRQWKIWGRHFSSSIRVAPPADLFQSSGCTSVVPNPPPDAAVAITTVLMLSCHRCPRFSLGLLTDQLYTRASYQLTYEFTFFPVRPVHLAGPVIKIWNASDDILEINWTHVASEVNSG